MVTRWKSIAQVLTAFSLLPWVVMLLFTPMAFDSGAPTGGLAVVIGLIWAYPLIVIAAFVAAAWSTRRQRPTLAALSASAPLLLVVALLVVLNQ
jgi:hypothetical protein